MLYGNDELRLSVVLDRFRQKPLSAGLFPRAQALDRASRQRGILLREALSECHTHRPELKARVAVEVSNGHKTRKTKAREPVKDPASGALGPHRVSSNAKSPPKRDHHLTQTS
jgi:hypothetical protein